jgi:hypothetical protein
MATWLEYQLWYKNSATPDALFEFKNKNLLPILNKYAIEDFLTLDEPEFSLIRVFIDAEKIQPFYSQLEDTINNNPIFSKVTITGWNPKDDARNRILKARGRAGVQDEIPSGGWQIIGTANGKWLVAPEELEKQIEAFSIFMSKVLGKFTKAYVQEMPYRVRDRWLMSVFLHLMLDSISMSPNEENEIRQFPYI